MTAPAFGNPVLVWPARPTCHDTDYQAQRFYPGDKQVEWRPPDPEGKHVKEPRGKGYAGTPYGYPFKACSYCGSMSAEDLYRYLTGAEVVRLDMADWKYGWPHKFYVEGIPNPKAGQPVTIRSEYSGGKVKHYTDPAPATTHAKFYNAHLADIADSAAFEAVTSLLAERTGVTFAMSDDGRLQYAVGPRS